MNLKEQAKHVQQEIPAIFIALKRKDTPWPAKLFAAITLVYVLSPLDLIPDFIPVLGYLDDLLIVPLLAVLTIHFIPASMMEDCRKEAKDLWIQGKPKKWIYAVPILLIWILAAIIILKMIR